MQDTLEHRTTMLRRHPKPLVEAFLRFAALLAVLVFAIPALHAQTTAQLSGSVTDPTGAVIPGATVTLVNEATNDTRVVTTDASGVFSFPALLPANYTIKVTAPNFQPRSVTGIELHAGDSRTVAALAVTPGDAGTTVNVTEAGADILPEDNGERTAVLTNKDIENLPLEGRDTTELLKVLPGATTQSGGLTNAAPSFNDLNISANESAIGSGIALNGVPNRGGTALLSDGVSVLDPGDMAGSIGIISPEMTQEVAVQTSNFGAFVQNGPVVVSAISKSGTTKLHGEGYFDARNDALNSNDWLDNHNGVAKGSAHYYYPGGNVGGPIPYTHQKIFGFFGYERFLQNQGNANVLRSYIPTPEMLAGDFTADNPDNVALCPNGFQASITGTYCNNLAGTILPDGTAVTNGHIPAQFLDPGAKALASVFPQANANPATNGGNNYVNYVTNINNGWVWRARMDFNPSNNDKFFVAYQQAYSAELAQGNGAHIYWTPGNSIPLPGGGLFGRVYTKSISGHFTHIFNDTTTNEFIAAWGFGNFPFAPPDITQLYKTTRGYPYGSVFNNSKLIPSFSSPGNQTIPDLSQGDIFEPGGFYLVRKEVPSFTDNFSKLYGKHTIKVGAFTQNTGNLQGNDGTSLNGSIGSFAGQNPNIITGRLTGSPNNPVANFIMGNVTGYNESSSAPVSDMAYQNTAFYFDDSYKASRRLNIEAGLRFEHVGHWYDRQGTGMAVFLPQRVLPDYNAGKLDPGFYWHGIDPSIPISGQPNRLAFVSPRFGMSWDVLGTGNTVVRGGWGVYRFTGQYNDYAASLTTAQAVQNYNLPGQKSVLLSQIPALTPPAQGPCTALPCSGTTGSQTGLDASDYGEPITYAYNLTIDQRIKWGILLDMAYVGNSASQVIDDGETLQGSGFTGIADQNKTPLGAFFRPDPKTGVTSNNPENLGTNTDGTKTGNNAADYRPFGYAYGTAGVYQQQSNQYSNYNGLQLTALKQTGRLTYDFNFTWSKTLGTGLQGDPFVVRGANYGAVSIDRPYVFNSTYSYQTGPFNHGNALVRGAVGGWTVTGYTTWQSGGSFLSQLGNNVPNFGLSETYDPATLPGGNATAASALGVGTGLGTATYYGTDAAIAIRPVLTCNPQSGLAKGQYLKLQCFAAPAIGQQGGQGWPYLHAFSYYDNDLAFYKSFPVREGQNVQFRFSMFNWLNHPLPQFNNGQEYTLYYLVNYQTKAIQTNTAQITNQLGTHQPIPAPWGYVDSKTQAPYSRILEFNVKYTF